MRTFTLSLVTIFAVSLGLLGCDKEKPPVTDPDTTGKAVGSGGDDSGGDDSGGDDGGGGGEENWHSMDRNARMAYMGATVMPAMQDAFKHQGFETFKCANCHGGDFKAVDFKMPNDLTPLDPENPIQSGMDLDEEMTKFMVSYVLPEMARMLDEQTDVTTGKGEFGCLSCHLSQ
jgi:hypothetical protein